MYALEALTQEEPGSSTRRKWSAWLNKNNVATAANSIKKKNTSVT
jgi:hypothetical protein